MHPMEPTPPMETGAERRRRLSREAKARQRARAAKRGRRTVTIEAVPAEKVERLRAAARHIIDGEAAEQHQLAFVAPDAPRAPSHRLNRVAASGAGLFLTGMAVGSSAALLLAR